MNQAPPTAPPPPPPPLSRLRMDLARRKVRKINRTYKRAVALYGNKAAHDVVG